MFRKQLKGTLKPKHPKSKDPAEQRQFVEVFEEVDNSREPLMPPKKPEEPKEGCSEDETFVYQNDLAAYYIDLREYESRKKVEDDTWRKAEDKRVRKREKAARDARRARGQSL